MKWTVFKRELATFTFPSTFNFDITSLFIFLNDDNVFVLVIFQTQIDVQVKLISTVKWIELIILTIYQWVQVSNECSISTLIETAKSGREFPNWLFSLHMRSWMRWVLWPNLVRYLQIVFIFWITHEKKSYGLYFKSLHLLGHFVVCDFLVPSFGCLKCLKIGVFNTLFSHS